MPENAARVIKKARQAERSKASRVLMLGYYSLISTRDASLRSA
ncbi:hypothetical protein [Hymenobacter norwichensis]